MAANPLGAHQVGRDFADRMAGLTCHVGEMGVPVERGSTPGAPKSFFLRRRVDAIDYVITNELCHIAVPHHGPEFFELLDRVLPDWPKRKLRLEQRMA
jgi:hypothetical protein